MGKRGPKAIAFWSHVAIGHGCWEWQGTRFRNGYGRAGGGKSKTTGAHRVAYELANGPIPTGMFVMHICDNPPCVRPDHLRLGTPADNLADMVAKGRSLRGRRNHAARLNEDWIRKIRVLYADGWSKAAIAREVGVSEQGIRAVIQGLTWGWVK